MKFHLTLLCVILAVAIQPCLHEARAQINDLNEPGSIMVFPLLDNINCTTFISITNHGNSGVWLYALLVIHGPNDPTEFEKYDCMIHLTQKETFWWDTSSSYNEVDPDGIPTQIPAFDARKGFLFICAVDDDVSRREINWNFLQGNALLFQGPRVVQYNAIPHQGLAVLGDGILNLDGVEYSMATSQAIVGGFAHGWQGLTRGTWVVCSIEIDYVNSIQPDFDINLAVWNQDEVYQSRHVHFYQFQQFDLKDDLQLDLASVFTPRFHFSSTCNHAVWSVYLQYLGMLGAGGNVLQHPGTGVPATVVLPPVPKRQH